MHLTLDGVCHWFAPGCNLFARLDGELTPGCLYGVVGPSGAGKTTLLSLLAGVEAPKEGRIARDGIASVQWVQQIPHGVARRSVLDHVALPLIAAGATRVAAEHEAVELLAWFNLVHQVDAQYCTLSGGEAQRLMLARGVAAQPDLLLVDEPTALLDRNAAAEVNAVLGSVCGPDRIVVVATKDPQTQEMCGELIDIGWAT